MEKRIKENIGIAEYKKFMNATRGNDSIRENTKANLLRTFCILYYSRIRTPSHDEALS